MSYKNEFDELFNNQITKDYKLNFDSLYKNAASKKKYKIFEKIANALEKVLIFIFTIAVIFLWIGAIYMAIAKGDIWKLAESFGYSILAII